MLSPQRLTILQAVIAAGSVNAAARNLNYSPATISQHLKALKRETGLDLFERSGRGITPTQAARRLAEQAATALTALERLDRTVADMRRGPFEYLAIASFSSATQAWIPTVMEIIRQRYPRITLEISLNEPHDGIGRHPADLSICSEPLIGAESSLEDYQRHPLITDEFYVALPRGHRFAEAAAVPVGELRDEAWIDHDIYDSPTGQIVTDACKAAGFTPAYAARLDDHHAALALVGAGLGISVLPHLALSEVPMTVTVKPLTKPTVSRRIVVHVSEQPRRASLTRLALEALHAAVAPPRPVQRQ